MQKITLSMVALLATSSLYASQPSNEELLKRIEQLEAQIHTDKQVTSKQKNTAPVTPITQKDTWVGKVKIGGDYRFSVDNLNYDLANGQTAKNDSVLTNRLWLNVSYRPNEHLFFSTKLAFNKVFGQPVIYAPGGQAPFDGFDWIASTTNTDDDFRVKNAYIDYKDDTLFGSNIAWDFGVGRRPTSYTKLLSLRDDTAPSSPLGHIVSAEFDGGHLGFDLDKVTGVSGMRVKLATGRGASYITPSLSPTPDANWGDDINMFDINFVPYSDSHLHTELQAMYITNLIDLANGGYDRQGNFDPQSYNPAFDTVGDMYLGAFMVSYDADTLNNTTFFASFGLSQTDPNEGKSMLGSMESETGNSYWVGMQTDLLGGRFGLEYNHGSQYWRSFTYAEDTMAGSKMATRGDAFEAYFTGYIMEGFSYQVRYTYMDYEYTGSNGFFGSQTGTPMDIDFIKTYMADTDLAKAVVDTAQDLRFYLRYHF
jgi:hypothetical protein